MHIVSNRFSGLLIQLSLHLFCCFIVLLITLIVLVDPSAKEKCEIDPYLPNVFASHVEVQETRGCLAPSNEGRGDKYVMLNIVIN